MVPRYLGQHFLINKSAINKIIAALDLKSGDTIIEIGPGRGALTLPLVEKCQMSDVKCKVIAIEKDPELAKNIEYRISNMGGGAEIISGDALKIMSDSKFYIRYSKFKVVGNIPYYITGKLLRILSELENKPKLTVLTIQREVAERIVAKPPKMNLLAAAVQIWAEPEIIMNLKPKDFSPPPEVDSAIIVLRIRNQELGIKELGQYYKLIKLIFKQPRKTVLNNLSTPLSKLGVKDKKSVVEMLKKVGLTGQERPQNLSLNHLIKLSTII